MAEVAIRTAVGRREAADMYGVSFDTITRAIHAGHLKAKKVGVKFLIHVDDLAEWFAALPDA